MDAFLATPATGVKKPARGPFPPLGIPASFAFTNLESRASLESATEASWFVLFGWERCLIFRGPERGALEREEFPGAGLRSKRNEARFSASLGKYHSFL